MAFVTPSMDVVASSTPDVADQRRMFLQAETAFDKGQRDEFAKLSAKLDDYPLKIYLDYDALSSRLSKSTTEEIAAFLDRYPDALLAERLRGAWLEQLAGQKKFDEFLRLYQPSDDVELQCYRRQAQLATGATADALTGVEQLWLIGQPQPGSCDAVFDAWRKSGGLTPDRIWERIGRAVQAGNVNFARQLLQRYAPGDKPWLDLWEKVARTPSLVEDASRFKQDHPARPRILAHGATRLAYRDVMEGVAVWDALRARYPFGDEQIAPVERTLSLLLAQNKKAEALPRLTGMAAAYETQRIREWRARAALHEGDWVAALTALEWLNETEQADPRWQYWRGRALEELGFIDAAQAIYRTLSTERNYHAFLAADRIAQPYTMRNTPIDVSLEELHLMERIPGFARAKELQELGRETAARREWDYTLKQLDPLMTAKAAKLAQQWGWHTLAIFTVARSGYWDDLSIRFPLLYKKSVVDRAREFNIEAAWVYGIVRQESAFLEDARSPRGALGLMQLLPSTAKLVAHQTRTPYRQSKDLLEPEKNIKLGSAFLKTMRGQLYNSPILATAAYNAGPGKVRGWLPKDHEMSADIWIETIPYDETRDYVERVLAYSVVYGWQLTGEAKSIKALMTPIIDNDAILTKSPAVESKKGDAG